MNRSRGDGHYRDRLDDGGFHVLLVPSAVYSDLVGRSQSAARGRRLDEHRPRVSGRVNPWRALAEYLARENGAA
jgi:hypothetical protein